MSFTPDEMSLMCMYDTTDKETLFFEIEQALPHIENAELADMAKNILQKLDTISETEFTKIEFIQPFGGDDIE